MYSLAFQTSKNTNIAGRYISTRFPGLGVFEPQFTHIIHPRSQRGAIWSPIALMRVFMGCE